VFSQAAWFNDWRRLFSTPIAAQMSDVDLNQITDPDSVKGWTVANVAKRTSLSDEQQARLRGWLRRDEAVLRWRLVHALGSFPSEPNFHCLLQKLDEDPEVDVRYGAVRSLVEMACISDENLREKIFDQISARAQRIATQPRVEAELARALIVTPSKAPQNWLAKTKHVAREFFQITHEIEKRDAWRSFVEMVDLNYAQ
jgi:hypothetical protein